MLNIDTRLLDQIKSEEITDQEFIILLLIAKRIGKIKNPFPSLKLLQEESKYGRNKVSNILTSLAQKGFLTKEQRHVNGRLSSNKYKIHTPYISVYIPVDGEELQDTPNEYTENDDTENQPVSINQSSLSINQSSINTPNPENPAMQSCSEVSPTVAPTEPLTVTQLGVGINLQGEPIIDLHSKDVSIENIDLKNNYSNRELPSDPLPSAKPSVDIQQAFEEVWKLYPRKDSKGAAKKKYITLVKKNPKFISIIYKAVEPLAKFAELMKTEEFKNTKFKYFFLYFSTWLNNNSWEDEFVENIKESGMRWDEKVLNLIVNWFEDKTLNLTSLEQTAAQPAPDAQPLSRADYLNAMNDMYNI